MKLLLVEDIKQQSNDFKNWVVKCLIIVFLFISADYLVGETLLAGLEKYFGLAEPADTLLIGHSHTVLGINKEMLEDDLGSRVAKYSRQGANLANRDAMIRQYINRQPGSVKTIVYGVDAHLFTSKGLSKNSLALFYPFIDDEVINEYLKKGDGLWSSNYLLRKIIHTARYSEVTISLAIRGFMENWDNYKRGTVDIGRLNKEIANDSFRKIRILNDQVEIFKNTMHYIRRKGINVVLLYIPTVDVLNKAEPQKYNRVISKIEEIANHDDGITFLNYNTDYAHRHELFYDPIHMNPAGQQVVTKRLASDLKLLID